MQISLRTARAEDALAIYEIKEQLRLKLEDNVSDGGFLLGTSQSAYEKFIHEDIVLVAENDHPKRVVGFAIVIKHENLVNSALFQRAEKVQWEAVFRTSFNAKRFAFFEQLGMLNDPSYRVYSKHLAFAITMEVFDTHEALFTTTLRYPIKNTAALPFIRVAGFQQVGMVDEIYPEIGHLKSDVYCLDRGHFLDVINQPKFKIFVERSRKQGYANFSDEHFSK